jgi:transposase
MRKVSEVLRLRFALGLEQRAIARACSISQSTVHEYLKRAAAAGIGWPLKEGWEQRSLEQALFQERRLPQQLPEHVLPDFSSLHQQLQQHPHLALQLAWEEYRQVHPDGYDYSRFCELYGRWRWKQDVVLRQNHTPGRRVLSIGPAEPSRSRTQTGEVRGAALFLMVLGASSYTYAEATLDPRNQPKFWGAHTSPGPVG